MLFGCIYRSPTHTTESEENNTNLNVLIHNLSNEKKYSHICLTGDFNFKINWQQWSTSYPEHSKEEIFLETLRDSFLYQHVLEPTRRRGTDEPSILDLILTKEESQIQDLKYHAPLGKSDHSVLSFNFNCYFNNELSSKKYLYDKANFEDMKRSLEESNWLEEFIQNANLYDVEGAWLKLKSKLHALRDEHVPQSKIGELSWKGKGDIPISQELRQLIKDKRRFHRKWIKSINNTHERVARHQFNSTRNKVKKMMTQTKRSYERRICSQSKNNPKRFWKHIRDNLKTKSGIYPLLESVNDENSIKFDDYDKAEILQNQFCSVFTEEPDGDLPSFTSRTEKEVEIFLTVEMVRKEVTSLDVNKAIGPDELHPRMLKELVDYITVPLFIIMKKTLINGCIPTDWKLANVSPIFKKGAKNLAENYRPISLTSIVCRLLEKIVKCQIMDHLTQEDLLSPSQHGFINRRSTVTQLLNYLDKSTEAIADGDVVDVIYFDFAKAFDTVPHRRLLMKIEGYGIKNEALAWIRAFLTDRYQVVTVNGKRSSKQRVLSGVPQGSVLGPLLFVLYINDLPEVVRSILYLFADDTKLLKRIKNKQDSLELQSDIEAMDDWTTRWILRFHPGKCHVLTLGKFENIKYAHTYKLGDTVLDHVCSEKDLGVTFDNDLSFEKHLFNQVKKANSMVGLIKRSFFHLTPDLFRELYVTFVRPHLEYAQVIWSPKLRKHSELLEGVQRRATRIVEACKHQPYSNRLQQIGIPTLEYRRSVGDMVEVFKHLHFYSSTTVPNKFVARTRPSRNHEFELKRLFAKDGLRGVQTNFFYYRSIKHWNALPREVVNSPSIAVFKKRIDIAWQNKRFI